MSITKEDAALLEKAKVAVMQRFLDQMKGKQPFILTSMKHAYSRGLTDFAGLLEAHGFTVVRRADLPDSGPTGPITQEVAGES